MIAVQAHKKDKDREAVFVDTATMSKSYEVGQQREEQELECQRQDLKRHEATGNGTERPKRL
ncbi:uncharacterized protein PHALS_00140 [Plasmopara halstedii]|uniref:Uncharacterized protein n=1 Tax=Plasmopara halstedii TaxID=4781 RepID=A0A0P1A6F7_PLAHL|nr:uncharacterized protein PHALS_00140 [Plasmopara halstedii]CEG35810.1 hypothetical protein PHALS_00140 [Plasmopara halstedii]|eukprot:XP_024572179.1 hypothetical protein PHALS_00140 [Plasmopara halstedii]